MPIHEFECPKCGHVEYKLIEGRDLEKNKAAPPRCTDCGERTAWRFPRVGKGVVR